MATKQSSQPSKRKNIILNSGKVYVTSTFNNTVVAITDDSGNVIFSGSTGMVGFKGARKSTPYAATAAIDEVVKKAKDVGLKKVKVYIKGPGVGRDAALRVLRGSNIRVTQIADVTPIPHNGCRAKKQRHG